MSDSSHIRELDEILSLALNLNLQLLPGKGNRQQTLDVVSGRHGAWRLVKRGLYIFLSDKFDQSRSLTSQIVRVGTHSIKQGGSRSTLWNRLSQHRGNLRNGGGNHRGSIFRLLVGDSIIRRDGLSPTYPCWGEKNSASRDNRQCELQLEKKVSNYIRRLPFLFINVDPRTDGPRHRAYLEKNLIALMCRKRKCSWHDWLGSYCSRPAVRSSGLWNNNHTDEQYDSAFVSLLELYLRQMERL